MLFFSIHFCRCYCWTNQFCPFIISNCSNHMKCSHLHKMIKNHNNNNNVRRYGTFFLVDHQYFLLFVFLCVHLWYTHTHTHIRNKRKKVSIWLLFLFFYQKKKKISNPISPSKFRLGSSFRLRIRFLSNR